MDEQEYADGTPTTFSEQDFETIKTVFRKVFEQAAGSANDLQEVAQNVLGDAIDVRTLLRVGWETAKHPDTQAPKAALLEDYELAVDGIADCTERLAALVATFHDGDYLSRLAPLKHAREQDWSPKEATARAIAARALVERMTIRHMRWSYVVVNYVNLVRGIDGAQSTLLARPTNLQRLIGLAKPLAAEGLGQLVPGIGFLLGFAKSQQPHIDTMLDAMEKANGLNDRLSVFSDMLKDLTNIAAFTRDRIREAATFEAEYRAKFDEAFGPKAA